MTKYRLIGQTQAALLKDCLKAEMSPAGQVATDCPVITLPALEQLWERWLKGRLSMQDGRVVLDYGDNAHAR